MTRRRELSGIFDWFKRLAPPPPGAMVPFVPKGEKPSQLPELRRGTLPAAPREESKQLSFFDFLLPEEERSERGLILPELPKPVKMFEFMAPAPPTPAARSIEEEQKLEKEVWGQMFKPSEEPPAAPAEMFEFLKPEAQEEARRFVHPDEWPFGEPPLWSQTPWQMPSTYEIAEFIRQRWDLPGIYEYTLNQVDNPYWRRRVEESAHVGEPATIDVDMISKGKNSTIEIANFLRIPDFVIEDYGSFGQRGIKRFTEEVLKPMFERVGKALDVFRPARSLKGWFELEPDEDMNFWIRYKERKQYPQLGQ
jgi:hypothetical protein